MRNTSIVAVAATALSTGLWAQTEVADDFRSASDNRGGVRLYGVTLYSGYYWTGSSATFEIPISNGILGPAGITGANAVAGAAATFGGSGSSEKGSYSWRYSLSYFSSFYSANRLENQGFANHRLSMNWGRRLSAKWTLQTSANGMIANMAQLFMGSDAAGSIAAHPTDFDQLAAGALSGRFTDPQLAALLNGAPIQGAPERGFLYGDRILTAGASVGLSWAKSERTSLSVRLAGARSQNLRRTGLFHSKPETPGSSLLPQTSNATATVDWSYSVSPRTVIGADASVARTFSRLQQGYAYRASLSLGRVMSRRWFAEVRGGAGKLAYTRQLYRAPRSLQHLFGGNLGFKTMAHTFLVSYDRALGDAYGLSSRATNAATGAWYWRQPGSSWSVSAGGGYQELSNPAFGDSGSWRVYGGVARSLGPHVFLNAQYIYMELPIGLQSGTPRIAASGPVVSLTWSSSARL
jgi:hypothetical protein